MALEEKIIKFSKIFHGLSKLQTKQLAYKFATDKEKILHPTGYAKKGSTTINRGKLTANKLTGDN